MGKQNKSANMISTRMALQFYTECKVECHYSTNVFFIEEFLCKVNFTYIDYVLYIYFGWSSWVAHI